MLNIPERKKFVFSLFVREQCTLHQTCFATMMFLAIYLRTNNMQPVARSKKSEHPTNERMHWNESVTGCLNF